MVPGLDAGTVAALRRDRGTTEHPDGDCMTTPKFTPGRRRWYRIITPYGWQVIAWVIVILFSGWFAIFGIR